MKQIRYMQNTVAKLTELLTNAIRGDSLLWANEITANLLSQITMSLLCLILAVTWILTHLGIFHLNHFLVNIVCIPNIILLVIGVGLLYHYKGSKEWLKNLALTIICITIGSSGSILGFRTILAYSIPAVLSTRYMSQKVTRNVCVLSALMIVVSSVAYCFIGASPDFNVIDLPANTVLTFNGALDNTIHLSNIEKVPYVINMFKYSILTNFLIYFIIAIICSEVSRLGYTMIEEQRKLAAEHAITSTELNVAKQIQEHAMPIVHDLKEDDCFDLAAIMDPAKEIGGDFYDFLMIDATHLALVIADVSGKGVPAAMFMMVSKLLIDNSMQTGKSPGSILTEVNHQLCEKNVDNMFVTVWLGIIDLENGKMVTANAGHEFPMIRRNGGKFEIFKDKHGFVLGGMDGIRYKETEFYLEPGDSLFVYTDGVTETNNLEEEFYGLDHTCEQLNIINSENMEEMLDKMKEDIETFAEGAPQFDDITMMGFRLNHYKHKNGRTFTPTPESIPQMEAYLEGKMEKYEVPMKKMSRMNVAIDEIYSNIVNYSHATWVLGSLRIDGTDDEKMIVVKFLDNGIPYNPLEKADPDVEASLDERKIGGLGVFLTKKLMNEVIYKYDSGINVNILKLKL